jgi:hypothetical protein
VKPTNAAAGHRQTLSTTSQFGIFISADNHWGFVEGTTTVTSTATVASIRDSRHHRTFTNDAVHTSTGGRGRNNQRLQHHSSRWQHRVRSNLAENSNFFQGQMDNFAIDVAATTVRRRA